MPSSPSRRDHARAASRTLLAALSCAAVATLAGPLRAQAPEPPRPMTFLDMQHLRQVGPLVPSPDGRWALYTLTTPDWQEARRQTDIHLVSLEQGVASSRQMTFTTQKNETSPQWSRDGRFFVFLSNRDAPDGASSRNQLYAMRPDGGEARRLTDTKEGVLDFAFSRDGRWLAYRSGKTGEAQLARLPVERLDTAAPETLTAQAGGVGSWAWAPDSRRHNHKDYQEIL